MEGREPFRLTPRDPALFFVQRLRDEAHRFAIGTHRARRKKEFMKSPLDEIPGIGPARKRALLHAFGTAKDVAKAGLSDLEKTPGLNAATAKLVDSSTRTGRGEENLMRQSAKSAVGAILVLLTLAGVCGALTTRSVRAATVLVFDNYNSLNCSCGFGDGFFAEEFSPTSDVNFAGAAPFLQNAFRENAQFSMGLYSSTNSGVPGSRSGRAEPCHPPVKRDHRQSDLQRTADPITSRH